MQRISSSVDEKLVSFCVDGNADALETYLNGGNFGKINHSDDKTGDTVLHLASSSPTNSYPLCRLLLDFGANPCCLNNKLESPVHCAAKTGCVDTLKLLIDGGGLGGILGYQKAAVAATDGSLGVATVKKHLSASTKSRLSSCTTRSMNRNLLSVTCEAENTDCAEYLVDEIMGARKLSLKSCGGESQVSESGSLDIRQFLEIPDPKQVVFFEMGADLAASNAAFTKRQLEKTLFGRLLTKTPAAFRHLLDSCVYTRGKRTFVDFFLFYNELGGSELNLLKILINCGRFDLLTHPVCELFLHLKSYKARKIYWLAIAFTFIDAVTVISYVLLSYGEVGDYFQEVANPCDGFSSDEGFEGDPLINEGSLYCIGSVYLRPPVIIWTSLSTLVHLVKVYQDRQGFCTAHFLKHRPELFTHFTIMVIVVLDMFVWSVLLHKALASLLVLLVCHNMVQAIARDPDIAILVEMVSTIQKTLGKILLSYVWLFVGWIVAFHVTMGDEAATSPACIYANGTSSCGGGGHRGNNSFHDLGSASAKVMAMFTGELGFETAFSEATSFQSEPLYTLWIIILYVWFIIEMCVILMNLLIGLSISNIGEIRQNADALRLTKEVVLQRYLESFMRLSFLPRSLRTIRIADEDVFKGRIVYSLCRRLGGDYEQKHSLAPFETECLQQAKAEGIAIPSTVVGKLDGLLRGHQLRMGGREKRDQEEVKRMLADIKAELEAIKEQLHEEKEKPAAAPV